MEVRLYSVKYSVSMGVELKKSTHSTINLLTNLRKPF